MTPALIRRAVRAAAALYHAGRHDDAIQIYNRLLKVRPNDAEFFHNLAVVQYAAGDVLQAVETLKRALMNDPHTAQYFTTMTGMLEDERYQAHMRAPFYGPFNGQKMRQALFVQLVEMMQPTAIFETGTFRGTTTEFIAATAPKAHLLTCELDANFFRFAQRRFAATPNVTVVNLDSRSFLRRYVPLFAQRDVPSLFYLDAHWDADDLPLLEELRIVFAAAPRAVVLIDDCQVWDDAGYIYDYYGPTRTIGLRYMAPLAPLGPRYFFPLSSVKETGLRRGSVVVTIDDALAERITSIPQLRPAPPQPDA